MRSLHARLVRSAFGVILALGVINAPAISRENGDGAASLGGFSLQSLRLLFRLSDVNVTGGAVIAPPAIKTRKLEDPSQRPVEWSSLNLL